jgi:catechol 2,3-dioxygenase-like lactoylglutathione lyase family enzyme
VDTGLGVTSLDHLVLTVRDLDATLGFYERLGFAAFTYDAPGLGVRHALRFGDQKLNLHVAGAEAAPHAQVPTPGSADVCFLTRLPPEEVVERLRAAGVAIEDGPVGRSGAVGPMTSVYFRDPDGNLLEVATPASISS